MSEKIGIIGAGSWGTAVAVSLARNGHNVLLWARNKDFCEKLNLERINRKYLPDYILPENISATDDMEEVCKDSSVVFFATPSLYLKETALEMLKHKPFSEDDGKQSYPIIAVLTKGFIPDKQGSPQFIIDALEDILPDFYKNHLVYVAGPSHGQEVAAGKLTGLITASRNPMSSIRCREILKSKTLMVYSSLDIIGVQVCAASKNIVAVAFGILDALTESSDTFGDNTQSLLLAAGLNEIQSIGRAMGATHPETFTSISGVGDLDVTCRSRYGRNRRFGREIITKNILSGFKNLDDLILNIKKIGYLPEGAVACKYVNILAKKNNLRLPICTGLYKILNKELKPLEFIEKLLSGVNK
ncbi:NAD(P)H-dependent glycerol-3-phosphate dehydrogenase [Treponema pedis]|uniref:NAD(P)H-dependent glycerol-3-phosphate dehydrogenase n=1 Tax=Treponema pedis TaxID=409322 RepID=UPI0004218999|nr:NAD(P)H-dependent glycerol-3-phosphate dehydrogenase [Treponema pedis]